MEGQVVLLFFWNNEIELCCYRLPVPWLRRFRSPRVPNPTTYRYGQSYAQPDSNTNTMKQNLIESSLEKSGLVVSPPRASKQKPRLAV